MTVWKQRFYRWNFFYVYRIRDDLHYLFFAWRLGRYELVTKLYVLYEVYASLTYTLRPFMLPIAYVVEPKLTAVMTVSLMGVYIVGVCFFNAWHLRRKKEMVAWKVIPAYFAMKFALLFVNTLSVYYALYAYAEYFSVRHPRVVENFQAAGGGGTWGKEARGPKEKKGKGALEALNRDDMWTMATTLPEVLSWSPGVSPTTRSQESPEVSPTTARAPAVNWEAATIAQQTQSRPKNRLSS